MVFVLLIGLALLSVVRRTQPGWWRFRGVRVGLYLLVLIGPIGMLLRWAARKSSPELASLGSVLSAFGLIVFGLLLSMPLALLVRSLGERLAGRRTEAEQRTPSPVTEPTAPAAAAAPELSPRAELVPRRAMLEAAVASVPATVLAMGGSGLVGAVQNSRTQPRVVRYAALPAGLRGLRVLQITDLHLGAFFGPDSIPELVEEIARAAPDLLVMTGDICDHLPFLGPALERIGEVAPPLGAYAIMGNHEYYRGARATRRLYDSSKIRMLVDEHTIVDVRGSKLVLSGIDDPTSSRDWGHARHIDRALDGAPSDAFHLALCHRPSGFDALAARRVDLTLSGHTHGAQVGVGERSVLEPLLPDWYLWGHYAKGDSQLYTSSGAGHWAAFRLACPSELPLITLEQA